MHARFVPAPAAAGNAFQRGAPFQIIPAPDSSGAFSVPDRGRPSQIAPGAAQRPAEPRARPDVRPAPSRPVCARSRAPWACLRRSGYTCKICRTAHNAIIRRFERLLYSAYIRQGQRVSARPAPIWHVLQCRARCAVSQTAPAPTEEPPSSPKKNPPEGEPNSGRISERVFIRFLRGFGRESRSAYTRLIVAGIVACHSRLIVAYSLTSSPVVSMVPSPSTSR